MSAPLIMPEQASSFAAHTDALFYFLCAISVVVSTGVVGALFFFSIRYGRKGDERVPMKGQVIDEATTRRLELVWSAIPLAIFLGIFAWGAWIWASLQHAPESAITIYVVGKRWMWKTQHISGQREINELHVPLGQPVKLVMTSEDVIHSFYVPAFRVKQDVLPGRYTTMWFEPTKLGEYHLFCAEYCGTKHSQMIGKIVVMEAAAYQTWLGGGTGGTLAQAGEKRFGDLGCATCHRDDRKGRGPSLRGLYGSRVKLKSGATVLADEGYLRESILEPKAKEVFGYDAVMPTYASQLGEDGVVELIAYIKTLTSDAPRAPEPAASADPSAVPSADPSAAPSAEPSADPAADPSAIPSAEPSAAPDAPPPEAPEGAPAP